MSILVETNIGNLVIDLLTDQAPIACQNFINLCKLKYYNNVLFYNVRPNFIAQTGDPTGTGNGGASVWYELSPSAGNRYFRDEIVKSGPGSSHTRVGTVAMASSGGPDRNGSQFYITLRPEVTYLDGKHTIFGQVEEGLEVLETINSSVCDEKGRPYIDIRIRHTYVLDSPFPKIAGFPSNKLCPSSPASHVIRPSAEVVPHRLQFGEEVDRFSGLTEAQIAERVAIETASASATVLEMVGDLPDRNAAPEDNILFVCKLNPVTTEDDLELIFSRFGEVVSCKIVKDSKTNQSLQYAFIEFKNRQQCEEAYLKMDNKEAERILEDALEEVGSSIEQFVKVCDEIIDETETGPRDARMKLVLADFLTYDNFDTFAEMMCRRGVKLMSGDNDILQSNYSRHKDRLSETAGNNECLAYPNDSSTNTASNLTETMESKGGHDTVPRQLEEINADAVATTEAGLLFDMIACAKVPRAVEAIIELLLKERSHKQEKLLLAKVDDNGNTLGMAACYQGEPTLLQVLVAKTADISGLSETLWAAKDVNGCSALHIACYSPTYNKEVILMLLSISELKINAKDNEGCTALHYAANNGNPDLIRQLLAAGASPVIIDIQGCSALDYAARNEHFEAVGVLDMAMLRWSNREYKEDAKLSQQMIDTEEVEAERFIHKLELEDAQKRAEFAESGRLGLEGQLKDMEKEFETIMMKKEQALLTQQQALKDGIHLMKTEYDGIVREKDKELSLAYEKAEEAQKKAEKARLEAEAAMKVEREKAEAKHAAAVELAGQKQDALAQLEKERRKAEDRVRQEKAKWRGVMSQHSKRLEKARKKIEDAAERKLALHQKRWSNEMQQNNAMCLREKAEWDEKLKEKAKEIARLTSYMNEQAEELADVARERSQHQAEMRESRERRRILAAKLKAMETENAELQQQSTRVMEEEMEEMRREAGKIAEEKSLLEHKLKSKQGEIQQMRLRMRQMERESKSRADSIKEAAEEKGISDRMRAQLEAMEAQQKKLHEDFLREQELRKKYYNEIENLKGNIRVYCRIRPLNKKERAQKYATVIETESEKTVRFKDKRGNKKLYKFDRAFGPKSTQEEVFTDVKRLIQSAVDGYNVCIFAYGQTGTGKTYTMVGDETGLENKLGITPRSVHEIFDIISANERNFSFSIFVSALELYKMKFVDLLSKKRMSQRPKLEVKQDSKGVVYVEGITKRKAASAVELKDIIAEAGEQRHVAETQMNAESSRSHLVVTILIESTNLKSNVTTLGKLALVDLAGSERAGKTGATGNTLSEAKSINQSLSALGNVVSALQQSAKHIPYRSHPLTMLMSDSIGGNAKTLMFVNVGPADYNQSETASSLLYATRVQGVTNKSSKNIETNEIRRLKEMVKKLQKQLVNK
eukprot:g2781.t1